MKTIKEIADFLSIDKQKVYRYIRKYHINDVYQENGVIYLDDAQETLVKKALCNDEPHQGSASEAHHEAHQSASLDTVIDALQEQLKQKDLQLSEKDKQIDRLFSELEKEREHSRELTDKIADLAHTAQQLHGISEGNNALQLMSSDKKRSWWKFWEPTK
ncbi:hypothetical protein V6615_16525 (plasmid) [Oscillospiraceae bacterium PP1C4]